MDYKIKFEYKGIGKQASQARQKAIQAQKAATSKPGGQSGSSINQNKELVSSINKLIDSNKRLESAIRRSSGGRGPGGGGIPSGGGGGAGSGIGRVGSSLGFLGVGIAGLGFAISKAQQVANANINLKSQQLRSVGMGGFRHGYDMYGATETGAAMAAYGRTRGANARGASKFKALKNAGRLSAVYGMGLEETGGLTGTFERAGGNLGKTAAYARGSGIDSDMPILLKGISSMMEDAITSGVNASEMSKDMGKQVSLLTMSTQSKSAAAGLGIIKSFKGVQQQVAGGKFGTYEGMTAARATRSALMEDLQSKGGIKKLQQSGYFSEDQAKRLKGANLNSWADITKAIGPTAAFQALQRKATSMGSSGLQSATMKEFQQRFGTGTESKQKAYERYRAMGGSKSIVQFDAAWQARLTQDKEGKTGQAGREAKGQKQIMSDAGQVRGSGAAKGAYQKVSRESLTLSPVANQFAKTSLSIEKSLINLAKTFSPTAASITEFDKKTKEITKTMGEFSDSITKLIKKIGKFFGVKEDPKKVYKKK